MNPVLKEIRKKYRSDYPETYTASEWYHIKKYVLLALKMQKEKK